MGASLLALAKSRYYTKILEIENQTFCRNLTSGYSNSFINMKEFSSNNINRNLIQFKII